MPQVDPSGGGYFDPPQALTLLDVGNAARVKGVWEGYQSALAFRRKAAAASVPTHAQWQGNRADRFRTWWQDAEADLDNVRIGVDTVISAVDAFIAGAWSIDEQLSEAEHLIRSNCQHVWASKDSNSISGDFTDTKGAGNTVTVTGTTLKTLSPCQFPMEWPAWLLEVRQCLYSAVVAFQQTSNLANELLSGAMAYFKAMSQFRFLARASAIGNDPLAAAVDPTWQQLTGGGVFRMPLSGFTTDPFGTKLMPDWYDPTLAQDVSTSIGKWEWAVDIGAIVLTAVGMIAAAATGQPEIAVGAADLATHIEVVVHGTKLAFDASGEGNTKDIPWDVADLVLDKVGVQTLATSITKKLISPEFGDVNEKVVSFVQARLREQAQVIVAEDGTEKFKLAGSALSEVAAEAQAEASVLLAGHVPASAMR